MEYSNAEVARKSKNILYGIGVNVLSSLALVCLSRYRAASCQRAVTGQYEPTDINSQAFALRIPRASAEGVQQRAYDDVLKWTGSETAAKVGSFVAGTGLSILNFLTKAPLGPAALPMMGLQAAGSTALEAQERGATAGTAFLLSTAAGLIEVVTEKLPLENLIKLGKSGKAGKRKLVEVLKQIAKQAAKQAAIEATEETISEVANTIVDIAVMGDKSGFNEYVKYLEQQGYDPQKARAEALFQYFVVNPAQAGAGGTLSGGITGGIFSTVGAIRGRGADTQSDVQQPVQATQSAAEVTEQPANISTFTAPETAQDATQAARQTVIDILAGQVSNSKADTIVKTPVLAQAFREVTGIELSGTASQRRAQVKAAAQNFVQSTAHTAEADMRGVGAAERGFSRLIVPTQSKAADSIFTEAERRIHPQIGSPTHIRYTNKASMLDAMRMLKHDYEGTKKRLAEPGTAWGAAEPVAARQILVDLTKEARKTGDYTEVVVWKKLFDQKGTEAGQALQVRQQFVNKPEFIIADAAEVLESEHVRNKAKKNKAEILEQIGEQADLLDTIPEGDTKSLIELIKRNSELRHTTGVFSKKTSAAMEWALNYYAENFDDAESVLRDIAAAQIRAMATDQLKTSWLEAIKTIRVQGMLSSVKTILRNLVSNNIFDPLDSLSNNAVVPLDMLISKATGTRSIAVDKSWFLVLCRFA